MQAFVSVFKALSDGTRLRIMTALIRAKRELCICELVDTLALAQYQVSRHMKELKLTGLVRERKEGRFVFYTLSRPENEFHAQIVKALATLDDATVVADVRRLEKRLALREKDKCVVGMKKCAC
jgi:ArsR family transcriptional regulator